MKKMKKMKKIKTFEEACKVLSLDPAKILPDVSGFPTQHQAALQAAGKLFIVADALNEGWAPDWNNDDEYKYWPYFDMEKDEENNPSGFRLDDVTYYYDFSRLSAPAFASKRAK